MGPLRQITTDRRGIMITDHTYIGCHGGLYLHYRLIMHLPNGATHDFVL